MTDPTGKSLRGNPAAVRAAAPPRPMQVANTLLWGLVRHGFAGKATVKIKRTRTSTDAALPVGDKLRRPSRRLRLGEPTVAGAWTCPSR